MSTTFNPNPARDDLLRAARTPRTTQPSRAWALSGLGAAVSGSAAIVSSGMVDAVYDDSLDGDADRIAAAIADSHTAMTTFHITVTLCAVLLVPFAVGLFRRLRSALGSDSLLPGIAAAGLLITSVVLVLAGGLDTEFLSTGPDATTVPELAVIYNHWIGTIPFVWITAGLAGPALFFASRHGAVPRWIGMVGLVMGGLTLVSGLSPLQYVAGMVGPLWLLVTSLGFLIGDRDGRG